MKISYNWLKQFIDINESPEKVAQLLTQVGLEVEHISPLSIYHGNILENTFEGLVIGEVLTCEAHPDADKLSKTTVDIGESIVPIVCGAPNVAQGQKVVVATVGTTLYPEGGEPFKIKKAKIRGEVSEGMICAEDEIGLGNSHEGIMVLNTQLPNGTPFKEYLTIEEDYLIEIGLTPNRVDASSHLGTARDLAILLQKEIKKPAIENFKKDSEGFQINVKVENTAACPRYAGVCIEGVKVAESPNWLKNRLIAIGLSPINNIVDITNYVLHELGQPLHAFDGDKIAGKEVVVKTLPHNTLFKTLDEVERKLDENDLMICDAEKGMCIAGVFGGVYSGVSESTTKIFLESAYFSPDFVRKTSQRHALKTDAAFRFERGTDPNMVIFALKRAALLIKEIAGGIISSDVIDIYPKPIERFNFKVTYKNIDRLIGKKLERDFIKNTLKGLEIEVSNENEAGFDVSVPPYRVDVQREADVIEELLRLYGYNNVDFPDTLSASFVAAFPKIDKYVLQNKMTDLLVANGFSEIVTNSLTKPEYAQKLKNIDENENVVILNKLSEELEVLRQSLIPSGLEVVLFNLNRRQKDVKVFEFGKTYQKKDTYQEAQKLALFVTGNQKAESWLQNPQKTDFYFVAGILDKILKSLGVQKTKNTDADVNIFAYGLNYQVKDVNVAQVGLLQNYITKMVGLKQPVFYLELDWEWLVKNYSAELVYQDVPKYPEVRRDLSLILDKSVSFASLYEQAHQAERKLLKEVNVFSVYEGESIGEGKKSYALSFILQDETQTLTDKVIDKTMQKLMKSFKENFNAVIRE